MGNYSNVNSTIGTGSPQTPRYSASNTPLNSPFVPSPTLDLNSNDVETSRMKRFKDKISFWKPKPVSLKSVLSEMSNLEESYKRHNNQLNTTLITIRNWSDYINQKNCPTSDQFQTRVPSPEFAEWFSRMLDEVENLGKIQNGIIPVCSSFIQCFTALHQVEESCNVLFKQKGKNLYDLRKSGSSDRGHLLSEHNLLNLQLETSILSFRSIAENALPIEFCKLVNHMDTMLHEGARGQRKIHELINDRKLSSPQFYQNKDESAMNSSLATPVPSSPYSGNDCVLPLRMKDTVNKKQVMKEDYGMRDELTLMDSGLNTPPSPKHHSSMNFKYEDDKQRPRQSSADINMNPHSRQASLQLPTPEEGYADLTMDDDILPTERPAW